MGYSIFEIELCKYSIKGYRENDMVDSKIIISHKGRYVDREYDDRYYNRIIPYYYLSR